MAKVLPDHKRVFWLHAKIFSPYFVSMLSLVCLACPYPHCPIPHHLVSSSSSSPHQLSGSGVKEGRDSSSASSKKGDYEGEISSHQIAACTNGMSPMILISFKTQIKSTIAVDVFSITLFVSDLLM